MNSSVGTELNSKTQENLAKIENFHRIYAIQKDSSVEITLDNSRSSIYLLSISHAYAGYDLYIMMAYSKDTTVSIRQLYSTGYEDYTVEALNAYTIKISQKGTGGISKAGILRIS